MINFKVADSILVHMTRCMYW